MRRPELIRCGMPHPGLQRMLQIRRLPHSQRHSRTSSAGACLPAQRRRDFHHRTRVLLVNGMLTGRV
eukprot:3094200-Rhodomonas_salina.2